MNKWFYILVAFLALYSVDGIAQTLPVKADTMLVVRMDEVDVKGSRDWKTNKARYQYNQMKHYVKTILPYLNEATVVFGELNRKINDPSISKKERKAYVRAKEDLIRDKFEKDVKKLNETQGMLLMKLISRQTGANVYAMLKEFKNPFTAVKWQTYARFNGFNLNRKYVPEEEPALESIMESLGYPLSVELYGVRDIPAFKTDDEHILY